MKKMNYIFNLMAGAVLLLSAYACSREEIDAPTPEKPAAKTEFRLGIADTKTSLGASEEGHRKVYWSSGDKVAINGIASDELSEVGEEVSSAVFTFDEAPVAPFNVIYPAGIYKDASTVTLPAYQIWKQGTFDDGMFPMAGYSAAGLDATMDYLCATLKISILKDNGATPDEDNIRVVSFEGLGGERISGDFSIDYQAGTLTPVASPSDADKKVSVVALNQSLSTDTALEVFIVVPAMNYSQGFSITVQDSQGHIMTKTGYTTNGKELEAGKLYTLPEFRFIPSGEATGIEIWTAEDLIAFATAYNNKEYSPLGSGLVATVMDDFSFDSTTSAAFNATGGIGLKINYFGDAEDYYFDGRFNGNGKTIGGLTATTPLFKATSSSAQIYDLTIDNTCTFTFTHNNSAEMDAGSVVGYHRGTLKNVTVNANMALSTGNISKVTAFGGLVGRVVVGKVEGCVYSGNLSVPSGYSVNAQKVHIGGLVGEITNADGLITGSHMSGTLDFEGRVASTSKSEPFLMLGGIVGSSLGKVESSDVSANNTLSVTINNADFAGTIINHSTLSYFTAEGGIVGSNSGTVSECDNYADIVNFILTTGANGTASDDNSRYIYAGGIVGYNTGAGSVSGSDNSGVIIERSSPRIQDIGGIVGRNTGTVSSCKNLSDAVLKVETSAISPYSARVLSMGGIIGDNGGTVTDVQNAGDLLVSRLENSGNTYAYVGGVVGTTSQALDGGSSKSISNSGEIHQKYTAATLNANGYNVGGIVGNASATIANVSNTGAVKYSKSGSVDTGSSTGGFNVGGIVGKTTAAVQTSVNSGAITFANSATGAGSTGGSNVGGIVGKTEAAVSDVENNGAVQYTKSGAVADAETAGGYNVGGIVGYSDSAVSSAANKAAVTFTGNAAGVTTGYVYLGGVAGRINASSTVNVEHCSNAANVTFTATAKYNDNSSTAYAYCYLGGIAGYVNNVDIHGDADAKCTNSGVVKGGDGSKNNNTANTFWVGGIAGYVTGSSAVNYCALTGSGQSFNDHFSNRGNGSYDCPMSGGIVGHVVGAEGALIPVANCEVVSSATVTARRGALGGIVGAAQYATVSNCTVPVNYSGSAYYIGGVVSLAANSTISNCTYTGTTIQSSQIQRGGGMVCVLDAGSTIDNCSSSAATISKSNGTAITYYGGVAASSVSDSTIQNCHYKNGIQICSDTNFTDGGGNVADL
jgi:hypothetical protein